MLVELGNLRRGQTVLIHAAAGAWDGGGADLQEARSDGDRDRVGAEARAAAGAGLAHAIDYRKADFEAR